MKAELAHMIWCRRRTICLTKIGNLELNRWAATYQLQYAVRADEMLIDSITPVIKLPRIRWPDPSSSLKRCILVLRRLRPWLNQKFLLSLKGETFTADTSEW